MAHRIKLHVLRGNTRQILLLDINGIQCFEEMGASLETKAFFNYLLVCLTYKSGRVVCFWIDEADFCLLIEQWNRID